MANVTAAATIIKSINATLAEPGSADINQKLEDLDLRNLQHFGYNYPRIYCLMKQRNRLPGEVTYVRPEDDPDYARLCALRDRQG